MSETITVTGNVIADPEQRVVREGEKVTAFRIAATRRRYDDQAGRWVDVYTNFYAVSAFKTLGLNAYAALRRGQRVIVTGRLRVKEWDNGTKQGVTVEITADGIGHDLLFGVTTLESSGSRASAPAAEAPALAPASAAGADSARPAPTDAWSVAAVPTTETADVPF